MIKIGFIDDYLDNWHANHYPEYISLAAEIYGIEARVAYAYAWRDHPEEWGMSTEKWCEEAGAEQCQTYEQLIERSDALMVICADSCLPHEELAKKALMSGKPLYCDKTFAPDAEAAGRMFELARSCQTPVFTCSAQRFCMELMTFQRQIPEQKIYCSSTGPGDMINYSIHQYEMLEALMGPGAVRCQAFEKEGLRHIVYEYQDGRIATFTQGDKMPFRLFAGTAEYGIREIAVSDYYMNFMGETLKFFAGGHLPVQPEDTMEIMKMQQAGRAALIKSGRWVDIK